jgi:hypothetical protein
VSAWVVSQCDGDEVRVLPFEFGPAVAARQLGAHWCDLELQDVVLECWPEVCEIL